MTIYQVCEFCESSGTTVNASFSTESKADDYISRMAASGVDTANFFVTAYTLDSE